MLPATTLCCGALLALSVSTAASASSFLSRFASSVADYGKVRKEGASAWEVPRKWCLTHPYLFCIVVNAFVLRDIHTPLWPAAPTLLPAPEAGEPVPASGCGTLTDVDTLLCVALAEFQVTRRFLESCFVSVLTGNVHIVAYLTSFVHYGLFTFSMIADSRIFQPGCRAAAFTFDAAQVQPRHWIALAMFLLGSARQLECHIILRNLRKEPSRGPSQASNKDPGGAEKRVYKIPYGGWFKYSSSPHYFAELIVYGAFVVASGAQSLSVVCLFVWAVTNLALTASKTHAWYLSKFKDEYPGLGRTRMIPYLW